MLKKLQHIPLTGELPSPKGVALAILEMCRKDDTTITEIAHIAQTDPALAGRLIRNANAASTGGGRPIASVTDAIMRLGMGTVRNLAMGFSLIDQYHSGPCAGFDYERFWSHSLLVALAMQEFSQMTGAGAAEELFACGLLSQIGRLALATLYPQEYATLLKEADAADRLAELEHERLHTDHNELTAALLSDWGLPLALIEPIYHHDAPDKAPFTPGSRPHQLTQLFYLAKRIGDLGISPDPERNRHTADLLLLGGKIGLDADQLGARIDGIVAAWHEWGELLKVPASALPSFKQMCAGQAPRPEDSNSPAALRVLLVDDDATMRCMLEGVLGDSLGHTVQSASGGEEALAMALQFMPQIVITDWLMPGMSGIELCRALRATEWGQTIYIIMLTGIDTREEVTEAFEAGVDDFLTKPVDLRSLRARLCAAWHYVQLLEAWEKDRAQLRQFAAELAISNRRLSHAAMTDQLTGLPNRRAGMSELDKAWSASGRSAQPMAALVIDVDHFKRINDSYGHAVGDQVLREVAQTLQHSARRDDVVCRLGGEEFLMVCNNTDLRAALGAGERLRKLVEVLAIKVGGHEIQLSISVGIAARDASMNDADELVNAADRALYRAKESGRNRSCISLKGQLRCGPWQAG